LYVRLFDPLPVFFFFPELCFISYLTDTPLFLKPLFLSPPSEFLFPSPLFPHYFSSKTRCLRSLWLRKLDSPPLIYRPLVLILLNIMVVHPQVTHPRRARSFHFNPRLSRLFVLLRDGQRRCNIAPQAFALPRDFVSVTSVSIYAIAHLCEHFLSLLFVQPSELCLIHRKEVTLLSTGPSFSRIRTSTDLGLGHDGFYVRGKLLQSRDRLFLISVLCDQLYPFCPPLHGHNFI